MSKPIRRYSKGRVRMAEFKNTFQNEDGERVSLMYTPEKVYPDNDGNWNRSNSYSLRDLRNLHQIIGQVLDASVAPVTVQAVEDKEVEGAEAAEE